MTLVSYLDAHADDRTALIEAGPAGDRHTDYGELRSLMDQARAGLVANGATAGDRIAVLCSNTRASVVALLGIFSAGMVAVPVNPSSPANEIERQLATVDARLLLVANEPPAGLEMATATVPGTIVPGVDPLPDGPPVERRDLDSTAPSVLLFTSGTAGPPKAAMLSNANLKFIQDAIIAHPDAGVGPDTVNLCVLPLSHVYGLNISLLTTLRAGGTVVLQPRFDGAAVLAAIERYSVTHFAGVPPMWRAILNVPDADPAAFDGVFRITTGASALPVDLFVEFKERFGVELSEGYGLTETASGATSHIGTPIHPGSVGVPMPDVEVVVVDADDRPAPIDDSGRIKVRGPNVFLGYWEDEEATKAVLDDDGWLHTGDVGVFSEDGYLSLVDREKDLIIVAGFNVFPFEVEDVVARHPDVDQAIVVGRIDEARGERVVAYVTVVDGRPPPSLDDIKDHCRSELARYKFPSELHVVDELPIAPTGKRIRRDLA